MQQIASQCANCGLFARRSLHHEEEYQSSVLLERLRTSNFPATDEEITHIRHTILPTVSDDISSIESKVASLHVVIRSMEEERERLKKFQDKYTSLISSHRTLPLEILSEIFLCTIPNSYVANAFDASGPMWQLSHVCQRWRNVALSLRPFWSTVFLRFPRAAQCEGDVQRLQTVLQRTRQRLLDVSLVREFQRSNLDADPSIMKRILNVTLAESCRWWKFHLTDGQEILYASLYHRLPRLESLSLHCALPELAVSVFKDCPRLTKLALSGSAPLGVESFPWHQITKLDLSGMEFNEETCIRLIDEDDEDEDEDEVAYTPITCSNMTKLTTTSAHIVDVLTIPHLHEIDIHPISTASHFDTLDPYKRSFTRSSCFSTLTSLSLNGVPHASSPAQSILSILSQMHHLTSLYLGLFSKDSVTGYHWEYIEAVVNSLMITPTNTVTFLPLLSSLTIWIDNHQNAESLLYFGPVSSFASTLKARWEGDNTIGLGRLKACHFIVNAQHLAHWVYRDEVSGYPQSRVFSDAERLVFEALVDDGMDLVIRVTSNYRKIVGNDDVIFAIRD
ncbi:hypothetical protein CPB85DRAFT_438975 [Mucidula mucida]|nr:hypothetical protein CPB85DRAFT_438975 [Mucidula mucida]